MPITKKFECIICRDEYPHTSCLYTKFDKTICCDCGLDAIISSVQNIQTDDGIINKVVGVIRSFRYMRQWVKTDYNSCFECETKLSAANCTLAQDTCDECQYTFFRGELESCNDFTDITSWVKDVVQHFVEYEHIYNDPDHFTKWKLY